MISPRAGNLQRFRAMARYAGIASVLFIAACAGFRPPPQAAPEPGAVSALDRLSPHRCNAVVASSLAGARIPVSDIRYLAYGLYRDLRRGEIVGYDAWMGLKSQPGAVVVQVDEYCGLRQVYARRGAQLPSAP